MNHTIQLTFLTFYSSTSLPPHNPFLPLSLLQLSSIPPPYLSPQSPSTSPPPPSYLTRIPSNIGRPRLSDLQRSILHHPDPCRALQWATVVIPRDCGVHTGGGRDATLQASHVTQDDLRVDRRLDYLGPN